MLNRLTETKLRHLVEKKLKKEGCPPLSDEIWNQIKPTCTNEFEDEDIAECLKNHRKLQKSIKSIRRQRRDRKLPGSFMLHLFIVYQRKDGDLIRQLFGFSDLIPFDKLGKTLMKFFDGGSDSCLEYPEISDFMKTPHIWEINRIYISKNNETLMQAKRLIEVISSIYHCHPALVLAYYLCGVPVMYEDVFILEDNNQIILQVNSPNVSPEIVAEAYQQARERIGYSPPKKGRKGGGFKAFVLEEFVAQNTDLTWDQRFIEFGKKYPSLKYSNKDSMQVMASKNKKRKKLVTTSTESKNLNREFRQLVDSAEQELNAFYETDYFLNELCKNFNKEHGTQLTISDVRAILERGKARLKNQNKNSPL